jgi:hypothetical protein
MFSHSNLPSKDWSNSDRKASELGSIGSNVNNSTIRDTDSLKNEYNNEVNKVKDKSVEASLSSDNYTVLN